MNPKKSTAEQQPFILIVDDVQGNLQILGNILSSKGHRSTPATSGRHALKIIEKRLPDLILLDIMMPEMDGFALCRQLKNRDDTKDIPVIFISALTDTSDKVKAFEAGGVDYITKPFQEEMLARVQTHLNLRNLQKRLEEKNTRLQKAFDEVKTLRGIIPICVSCKKIRDDKGYWNQVEAYIEEHSQAEFSHSLCVICAKKLYPEIYEKRPELFEEE